MIRISFVFATCDRRTRWRTRCPAPWTGRRRPDACVTASCGSNRTDETNQILEQLHCLHSFCQAHIHQPAREIQASGALRDSARSLTSTVGYRL